MRMLFRKKLGFGSAVFAILAGCSATQDLGSQGEPIEDLHAVTIAIGQLHKCMRTDSGAVKCWGDSTSGALGNGTRSYNQGPPLGFATQVTGLASDIVAISTDNTTTCAVTSLGGLKCWGGNSGGRLGVDATGDESEDSEEPSFRSEPVDAAGLTSGVKAVSIGGATCALMSEGTVKCWGAFDGGFVPIDILGLTGVTAIVANRGYGLALSASGSVSRFFFDNREAPQVVPGLESGILSITRDCATTNAHTVKCWDNAVPGTESSPVVDVAGLDSVAQVASDFTHKCALTSLGAVKCWGLISWGGVEASGLPGDEKSTSVPVDVPGMESGITSISVAPYTTCAVRDTGRIACVEYCYSNASECNLQPSESRPE